VSSQSVCTIRCLVTNLNKISLAFFFTSLHFELQIDFLLPSDISGFFVEPFRAYSFFPTVAERNDKGVHASVKSCIVSMASAIKYLNYENVLDILN
jgi:hypothetical protein